MPHACLDGEGSAGKLEGLSPSHMDAVLRVACLVAVGILV